jgi:hypothetical protein
MSYDINIGERYFNETFNVSAVFYDHLPGDETCRGGLFWFKGKTGSEAIPIFKTFYENLNSNRDKHRPVVTRHMMEPRPDEIGEQKFLRKYDPKNGWGSTLGAIVFMAEFMIACVENPDAIIDVSA